MNRKRQGADAERRGPQRWLAEPNLLQGIRFIILVLLVIVIFMVVFGALERAQWAVYLTVPVSVLLLFSMVMKIFAMRTFSRKIAWYVIDSVLLILLNFLPVTGWLRFVLYLIPYLIVGYDILIKAGKGIKNRQVFDECFLMAVATVGAIALAIYEGSGDYTEAIAVMLFYQVGEWFQSYAVGKSRRNISDLMDIRPDYANMEQDGKLEKVDPDEVEIGSVIVVQPGEKVPIDGIILEGSSTLNTAALTGESIPKDTKAGDEIISGCINMTGVLKIRTTKEFGESTVSKILDLVENASSRKSRSEDFISKFARV